MGRLLLVSNRLPVTVKRSGDAFEVTRSAGGLATGLSGPHQKGGGLWLGWPGPVGELEGSARQKLEAELSALRTVPLYLSDEEVSRYYEGFSNGVLWPLFHYSLDRIPNDAADWDAYRSVNEKFADARRRALPAGRPDLGPRLPARCSCPGCSASGCPMRGSASSSTSPSLPPRCSARCPGASEILRGLLGADLIGFHTLSTTRGTSRTRCCTTDRQPNDVDQVDYEGRMIADRRLPDGHRRAVVRRGGAAERGDRRRCEALRSSSGTAACSSGSIGSTTRRASPSGCSRSTGCSSENPELRGQGALSSRSRCRRATNVVDYEQLTPRGRRARRADQRRVRHARAGRRCTTSTARSRPRQLDRRSTARPT